MAGTRAALEIAGAGLPRRRSISAGGWRPAAPRPLHDGEEETALRVLSRCFAVVGGRCYRPKLEAVERLYLSLREGGIGRGRTLGGCRIMQYRDGRLLIAREPDAADDRADLPPGATIHWDGRFTVKSLLQRSMRTVVRLGLHPEVASAEASEIACGGPADAARVLREDGEVVLRVNSISPMITSVRMAIRRGSGCCSVQAAGTFVGIRIRSCLKRGGII